uniref:Uncharacterized protein n=1 Tax=mine drainage metagenome TaxID=410659 RepID=E6Q8X3_9ZZZZ
MLNEQEHNVHVDEVAALFSNRSNRSNEIDEEAVLEAFCENVALRYEAFA